MTIEVLVGNCKFYYTDGESHKPNPTITNKFLCVKLKTTRVIY